MYSIKTLSFSAFLMPFVLLYTLPTAQAQLTNPWILKNDLPDMKVYYRDSEDSNIKELRITFDVQASLTNIMAVLMDVPVYPDWAFKCIKSRVVEHVSDTEMYYYNEIDFPWPMSNRDLVAYSTVRQDPVTKKIYTRSVSAHTREPENADIVRVKLLEIRWEITPTGPNSAHIDYFLMSDPGGTIPTWMINLAIDSGPTKSMRGFQERLKMEKYKNAQLAYIDNLD